MRKLEEDTKKFFQDKIEKYGVKTIEAVGWRSHDALTKRWSVILTEIYSLIRDKEKFSILDVGCGNARFCGVLKTEFGIRLSYTGLDIVPQFIEEAKLTFPDAKFICDSAENIEKVFASEKFDIVMENGALSFSRTGIGEDWNYYMGVIDQMWGLAQKGVILTLLSNLCRDRDSNGMLYYCPQDLMKMVLDKTRRFTIKHDYLPNDVMVAMRKDDASNYWD